MPLRDLSETLYGKVFICFWWISFIYLAGEITAVETRKLECKIDAGFKLIIKHISLVWWFHVFLGHLGWKRRQTTWIFNPAPQDFLSLNWKDMHLMDGSLSRIGWMMALKELWWTSLWPRGDQWWMAFLRGHRWDQHQSTSLSVSWTVGLRVPWAS